MGHLASIGQHAGGRAVFFFLRRTRVTRPSGIAAVILPRLLCACCCLALAAPPGGLVAQSGRRRPPSSPTAPRRSPDNQRPRTVKNVPAPTPGATQTDTSAPDAAATVPTATPEKSPASPPSSQTGNPAAPTEPDEVDEDEVVRINSNLVPVPASVIDVQGRAVTDLELKDFELRVDGVPKAIGDLSRAETPVRMALLFDNSSSLTAAREFEKQAAVRFFRSVVRPVDRVAIYSVSTIPTLVRPLTSDVGALVRTIERFDKPEGATALFDAIGLATQYLRPQQGRKVIIIVSDGADTISDLNFDDTLRLALAADCQIYAVQTGHSENANLRDLAAERRLQEFAAQTGGAVYTPKRTDDLDRAFAQIAADLAQQYVLGYYPTDDRRDGRFRAISLRVTTRPNVRVRTRKGYYAPKG